MIVWILWFCFSCSEVVEQLFYSNHLFLLLLVRSMVVFLCEEGRDNCFEKGNCSFNLWSSGLFWGSSAFNIGDPSHDNPFHTLRSGTFAMKLLAFDLHLFSVIST